MHIGLLIAATAALALSTNAGAEPQKRPVAQPLRPAAMQLASVEKISSPGPTTAVEAAAEPVKRPRSMRVTTCRCGDLQAKTEPQH